MTNKPWPPLGIKWYYHDDYCALAFGDCRELLPRLEAGSVDLTVSSPPYNQMKSLNGKPSGMWANSTGGAGFYRKWQESGYADDMDESEYQRWQLDTFKKVAAASRDGASLFYNHQLRWRDGECLHPVQWFRPRGWRLRQEIIWNRGGGMMMNARMFCRFEERIIWFVKGDSWKWNQEIVGLGTIWKLAREQQQQGKTHPVEFPIEIPQRCALATTEPGDVILDPFAGSCTTLRAAKDLGRRCIGFEIEERYCEIGARRLEQGVLAFPEPAETHTSPDLLEGA